MPDLKPITPLGGQSARIETISGVTLCERTEIALASVAARATGTAATAQLITQLTGVEPPAPGHAGAQASTEITAFWMGPELWMLEAPMASHEDLAAQVQARAQGAASVTEQTDAWCRFDLSGSGIASVMALLCPLDMRDWRAGGRATRTSIDHLGCLVVGRAPEKLTIYGPRSSAGSLHHALLTAMRAAL